jgi:N-acetylglucosamine-6-phosphate deacetylase
MSGCVRAVAAPRVFRRTAAAEDAAVVIDGTERAEVCFSRPCGVSRPRRHAGRLVPGYRADIVALDGATVDVLDTWVDGAGREDQLNSNQVD